MCVIKSVMLWGSGLEREIKGVVLRGRSRVWF